MLVININYQLAPIILTSSIYIRICIYIYILTNSYWSYKPTLLSSKSTLNPPFCSLLRSSMVKWSPSCWYPHWWHLIICLFHHRLMQNKYQFKFLVETISKIHLMHDKSMVWNMNFDDIGFDGEYLSHTDFHMFQMGRYTTNQMISPSKSI